MLLFILVNFATAPFSSIFEALLSFTRSLLLSIHYSLFTYCAHESMAFVL